MQWQSQCIPTEGDVDAYSQWQPTLTRGGKGVQPPPPHIKCVGGRWDSEMSVQTTCL